MSETVIKCNDEPNTNIYSEIWKIIKYRLVAENIVESDVLHDIWNEVGSKKSIGDIAQTLADSKYSFMDRPSMLVICTIEILALALPDYVKPI